MIMEAMEWRHLPEAGGLYDQSPDFIAKMTEYISTRNRYEKEKQDKEKNATMGPQGVRKAANRRR